jgi:indoleacetamide hydrolase
MERRSVLSGLLAGLAPRWAVGRAARAADPFDVSAEELAALFRSKRLGVVEHARQVVDRVERARSLNAFITFDAERFLEDAQRLERSRRRDGLLFGVPVPIKDSINTAQYPTTAGTTALKQFQPAEDAPLVAQLRQQGALVLGKTNLHELSYGWTSNNRAYGAVHNPYDLSRIPGGSSGGTAAAVAARLAPFGVAEDTEGSIRVPAALCGLAGFRPTTGRYTTEGAVPISPLFDQIGPVAAHARDLLLFDRVAGPSRQPIAPATLHGVRLAVVRRDAWTDLHPDVESAAEAALRRLQERGVELVEAEFPDLTAMVEAIAEPIQNRDVRVALTAYLHRYHAPAHFDAVVAAASADIRGVFDRDVLPGSPGFVTDERYREMVTVLRPQLQAAYAAFFARTRADAMVFPTTRVTAPRIGEEDTVDIGGRRIEFTHAVAGNISAGSTAGLPGLVLPIGLDPGGLPISLEFDGPSASDARLLSIAAAVESALGRLPPPRALA